MELARGFEKQMLEDCQCHGRGSNLASASGRDVSVLVTEVEYNLRNWRSRLLLTFAFALQLCIAHVDGVRQRRRRTVRQRQGAR